MAMNLISISLLGRIPFAIAILFSLGVLHASPESASPFVLFTYDARPLKQVDLRDAVESPKLGILQLLSALQGLANRYEPRLTFSIATVWSRYRPILVGLGSERRWVVAIGGHSAAAGLARCRNAIPFRLSRVGCL